MERKDVRHWGAALRGVSRRGLLKGAAALAAASAAARWVPAWAEGSGTILAYVGTYTPHGEGIYLFSVDPSTGTLTQIKVFPSNVNPSWLAFDPTKKYLYAANEISNFMGGTTGSVTAYSVNLSNGDLTFLNVVSSQGAGPAHLSVHPSGKYVFVANYGGGNVAVLPVQLDGSLGNATDVKADNSACSPACAVGPTHAAKAPPGSFAISGHDAPHAHMIQSDPAGNFVIVNDLGLDRTIIWQFDLATGKLSNPKTVQSSSGAGPRHFAFDPSGSNFYSLNEEASTVAFMTYDAASGSLNPVQEIQTLPDAFVGTNFTSEVIVSADGNFLYTANRLHDSIEIFAVHSTGELRRVGDVWTRGDYPRNINIDPTGNFLYACNQRGDSITTYSISGGGRKLRFSDQYTPVGSPACIVFLTTS